MTCDARIDDEETGVGISLHSRYVDGEDRMIEFSRDESRWGRGGAFALFEHGSALTGRNDTGVRPEPGIWYRLKVRTEVEPGRVLARAKLWPADRPEPSRWQAEAEDRSPDPGDGGHGGALGLGRRDRGLPQSPRGGSRGQGAARRAARPARPAPARPRGSASARGGPGSTWRSPAAREVPPGTPVVILSHMADVVREASRRGLPVVLAGHTHGGQVRIPFFGALTTRSSLGAFYDQGRFEFAAPNDRGLTTLYINPGVGMSVMPVRFDCPPRWALVELGTMKIEIELDDALLAEAMRVSGITDLEELICVALRAAHCEEPAEVAAGFGGED